MNLPLLPKSRPAPPAGVLGPEAMEIRPRRLLAGETWCETIAVARYPGEVSPGWLAPLLAYPGPVDVALHVEPVENSEAARHLRRQQARFESTRRIEAKQQRLGDPEMEAAARDAEELAAALARGEGRLFRVGLYVTVRAPDEESLAREAERVRNLCRSMLLEPGPVSFRALEGWTSTLPLGIDAIRRRWTFDTKALAASFPFASAEMEGRGGGVFLGRNATTGGLVFVDRFALENHNQVILARSGAGKSYLAKVEILRSLYAGVEVLVIDPENEYGRLAETVGGAVIRLGPGGERLNPLDLAEAGRAEALTHQALFVHTLVAGLLGEVSSQERAALDRAILAAYERAGITADPRTHARPAPLLRDVVVLLGQDPDGRSLAARLDPYVTGSHKELFDRPTTVRPEGHLVVFSLRDLPEELKTAGTLLALDAVWRRVARGDRRPRIVVVDEAWWLLGAGRDAGARFLQRLAKSSRKHWCGLTTITQDVADVLSTELGQAVVTNAAHQVLLGQSPQAMDALARAFNLSEGERSFLLTCDRGEGVLVVGNERAALQVVASETEHETCKRPGRARGDGGGRLVKKLAGGVALVIAIPAILLAAAVGSVSGGGGSAQGALCGGDGPTPAVQAFREEAFARFPDLQSLGVCNVRYIRGPYAESGSSTWSQHAYCNAEDYTRPGAPGTLGPFLDWIEDNRERLSVNHLITYPAGSGLEHVVHVDFHPAGTGDPRSEGSRPCEAGELEAVVLSNPRLSFLPEAAADVTEGRVDDRLLQLLLVLSDEYRLGPIGPFISGHSYYVAGT